MYQVFEKLRKIYQITFLHSQIDRILPPSTAKLIPLTAPLLGRQSQVTAAPVSNGLINLR